MDKFSVLKDVFGYDAFRPGQETLIDAILSGRDAIGVMPTGAGKSVCFQVPALLLPGVTLVISPLISLMKDQVAALKTAGVAAAYLNSALTQNQYALAVRNLRQGMYKIVYVAPERLLAPGFLAAMEDVPVSLLAVDEAHCISQWGQDFRPSYTQIPQFLESLPHRPVVAAFTATATDTVKADIMARLALQSPADLVTGFDRPNLFFEVLRPRSKDTALLQAVRGHNGGSGVVYCSTRKAVEQVCEFLRQSGENATRYHAGLSPAERQANQDDFLFDRARIMVATNAFGMGIDKSNVRFVVHYNMPLDLESYYQEAGRAGRDGLAADCTLLYSGQDVMMGKFLLEKGLEAVEDKALAKQLLQRGQDRLRTMTFYCTTRECLRRYILHYFGQAAPQTCDNCGNCQTAFETVDITRDAQRILGCVERTNERFGASMIAHIVRGAETERILAWHLDDDPVYGSMARVSQRDVLDEIAQLIALGALVQQEGQYPTLALGGEAEAILAGYKKVEIKRAAPAPDAPKAAPKARVPVDDPALFDRLREVRKTFAARESVPAFVVFTDATLADMCAKLPRTPEQFTRVSGVGTKKADRYAKAFLAAIAEHLAEKQG